MEDICRYAISRTALVISTACVCVHQNSDYYHGTLPINKAAVEDVSVGMSQHASERVVDAIGDEHAAAKLVPAAERHVLPLLNLARRRHDRQRERRQPNRHARVAQVRAKLTDLGLSLRMKRRNGQCTKDQQTRVHDLL